MPTPSPLCLVADGLGPFNPTFPNGLDIVPGDTVSVVLQSPAGVSNWYLQIGLVLGNPPVVIPNTGTDEQTSSPPALVGVNGAGLVTGGPTATVTFVFPNAPGRTLLFSSTVTGTFGAITTTFALFSRTVQGFRVGAAGMTREGSNSYGWASIVNPAIRNIGQGGGGGQTFKGTSTNGSTASLLDMGSNPLTLMDSSSYAVHVRISAGRTDAAGRAEFIHDLLVHTSGGVTTVDNDNVTLTVLNGQTWTVAFVPSALTLGIQFTGTSGQTVGVTASVELEQTGGF